MKILLVGSGGREHALAWTLAKSSKVTQLLVAPGSHGIEQVDKVRRVDIAAADIDKLVDCALRENAGLTIVGPEAPLVVGIADRFREKGLPLLGPQKAVAQLEGSKSFAKRFMLERHIPTAQCQIFGDPEQAVDFVRRSGVPWVVKADGLAGGKGVIVTSSVEETITAIRHIMQDKAFGEAGQQIVLEQRLYGEEVSVIGLADGQHVLVFESAQDYKRLKTDDLGPNTGGMGAYSPTPVVSDALLNEVRNNILARTIMNLAIAGTPFNGFLYAGLMITGDGPKVLEYNVRFGDPEAQAILPRLKTDLAEVLLAAVEGRLNETALEWDPRPCVCVVLAARGYPEKPVTGDAITGLEAAAAMPGVRIFHAGTRRDGTRWVTAGGRVLNVVALGRDHAEAVTKAYEAVDHIRFDGMQVRRDIGRRAVARSTS